MPTVKELQREARAAGIRYAGLNKAALEAALRAYSTTGVKPKKGKRRAVAPPLQDIDPMYLPDEALRHFDCDQVYALTGKIPIDKYQSRVEAAENGHFACVKMMDEKGIGVSLSPNERYENNIDILAEAYAQANFKFIEWALTESGNHYYILPPRSWVSLARDQVYQTLVIAIENYGRRTSRQLPGYNRDTMPPTKQVFSLIMGKLIRDIPKSNDFIRWAVSPETNPKYFMEFATTMEWIKYMILHKEFGSMAFYLEEADITKKRKIVAKLNTLIHTDPKKYIDLREFLMANSHLIPNIHYPSQRS
jgi:hypothetical protein